MKVAPSLQGLYNPRSSANPLSLFGKGTSDGLQQRERRVPVLAREPVRVTARALLTWAGAPLAALALALGAPLTAQQHAGSVTPADIEAGARLYGAQCAPCHGSDGNLVVGVDLRSGTFRHGSSDEDLARTITQGIPGTAMLAQKLGPSELSVLIAYIRSMSSAPASAAVSPFEGGDAAAGRMLVEGRGNCLSCHRIYEAGSRRATNLSDIGAIRSADALAAALADPGDMVAADRRFIRAVTSDGRVVTGRRMNEDSFTVQLLDERERLVSLVKSELREYTVSRALPEPPHGFQFTDAERRDLVTYLLTLKGLDPVPPRGIRR